MASRIAAKRLQKELTELQTKGPPTGCRIIHADNLEEWVVALSVLGDSCFQGEEFALVRRAVHALVPPANHELTFVLILLLLQRFRFSNQYPIDSPEVTFLTSDGFKPPQHPHVYTNGGVLVLLLVFPRPHVACATSLGRHICASVLGSGWSPVLNVQSLLITMQSMLASCKSKELPPDNDRYVRNAPKSPKDTRWAYHDDTV
ncbi:hypothetical protein JCM3775_003454 [Rhodotorula graminis]